jgi:phosphatidylglycerophosphate synthase
MNRFVLVNIISVSRIAIAPVFLFLYVDKDAVLQIWSIVPLMLIFSSDVLDGFLARRWKVTSKVGYLADGLGDRASYVSMFLAIGMQFKIPLVLIYLAIVRDIILYASRAMCPQWYELAPKTRFATKFYAGSARIVILCCCGCHYGHLFGLIDGFHYHQISDSPFPTLLVALFVLLAYVLLFQMSWQYRLLFPHEFQDDRQNDGQ